MAAGGAEPIPADSAREKLDCRLGKVEGLMKGLCVQGIEARQRVADGFGREPKALLELGRLCTRKEEDRERDWSGVVIGKG